MMELKIFVITLKENKERQNFIKNRMKKLGLDFEFFWGVNGSNLEENELKDIDQEYCFKTFGHYLSKAEIGCALSHIQLYEKIIKNGFKNTLILEDDTFLLSISKKIIKEAMKKCNYELLYVYHGRSKRWPFMKKLPLYFRLAKFRPRTKHSKSGISHAAAYILSLSGTEKLLELAYPVRMPADYLLGRIRDNKLRTYGIEPSCADTDLFRTTINDRNYGPHI